MSIKFIAYYLFIFLSIVSTDETFSHQLNLPREKVHLHLDKSFYSAGDTLWFKAYTVTASNNEPSVVSKVLYVELFDPNGKPVSRLKLPMRSGLSHGDIMLDDTLRNGSYHLRAYTNYMRNYGETTFFEREFELTGGFPAKTENYRHQTKAANLPDVQFLAEGGDLVAGLRSRVGVKVTGVDGLGLPATGELTDDNGKAISYFTATHAGIGSFIFTPQAGQKYFAQVRLPNGALLKPTLPAIKELGYTLSVNNMEADTVYMSINQSKEIPPDELLITAGNQEDELFSARILPQRSRVTMAIPRKQLPAGVVRVTLYAKDKKPLAERLLFNQRNEALNLKVSQVNNSATDSTIINLTAHDEKSNPLQGSFSLAVVTTGNDPYQDDDAPNIWANLLLTSEIKGNIEHSNYYFTSNSRADSTERAKQLDNLLLTQGWRRFVKNTSAAYTPETGLNISGKLLDNKNQPLANTKVRLFANSGAAPLLIDTLTDVQGRFVFDDLDFPGPLKYLVQTPNVKNKYNTKVIIDSIPPPVAPLLFDDFTGDTSSVSGQLTQAKQNGAVAKNNNVSKRGIILKEVSVKAKKPVYSSSGGDMWKTADKILGPDKFKNVGSIKEVIEWSGSLITWDKDGFVKYRGRRAVEASNGFNVIVDGTMYTDTDLLTTIQPRDVESVEIFLNGTMVGGYGKGMFVINTKRKNPNYNFAAEKAAGISNFTAEGYAVQREFYTPQRSLAETTKFNINQTIYWNPYVFTDETGKTVLKFLQLKSSQSFKVIIEGITADGRIGRAVYNYDAGK